MKSLLSFLFLCLLIIGCDESSAQSNSDKTESDTEALSLYSQKVRGGAYYLFGYKNSAGRVVINAKYDFADEFIGEVAPVAMIKKSPNLRIRGNSDKLMWGLINSKDSVIVSLDYYQITPTKDGNFAALGPNDSFLFNSSGDTLKPLLHNYESNTPYNDSLIYVSSNNLNGLADSSYNYVIEPKYHWFSELENGFYRVEKFDDNLSEFRAGYVDKNGKEVLPTLFRYAGPFKDSLAIVSVDGEQFLLTDTRGNTISTFNEFVGEKIDKNYSISDMATLKKCLAEKERIIIYELINCRNTILPELLFQNFTMSCGDSECYNKHEFSIFKSGYVTKESYYEGSPNLSIHINSAELNTAIQLSDSIFTILGYNIMDIEQSTNSYKAKFEKTWSNSRFLSKGEIRINCNSKECVLSPIIYNNY